MSDKELNDKLFDELVSHAADMYFDDMQDYEPTPEMTEDELNTMALQKEHIHSDIVSALNGAPKKRLSRRKVLVLVVAMIGILALAVSASAIKNYISEIILENDDDKYLSVGVQRKGDCNYSDVTAFEKSQDLIILNQKDMPLSKITDTEFWIELQYGNDDKWVLLSEQLISSASSNVIYIDNNTYYTENSSVLDMDATIVHMTSEIGIESHMEYWASDSVMYEITTNC